MCGEDGEKGKREKGEKLGKMEEEMVKAGRRNSKVERTNQNLRKQLLA